ncbi:riboflavin synthase [Aquibacillus koreensis]|uniref:Riboflavin synthase n=1 Tax=Aquibacillus koreensis TaxID=279446 RepID=A0A9X4AL94_9BACI|nr:riboflavin synthase [Aquibacillus koreensis]MCT2534906.1 riboflavin synthase [Aquibacillus koreensis]MDC3422200.1 riboflavin synthase [Aquibacillus koreensis]
MFTGIVEEKGKIKSIEKNQSSLTLKIDGQTVTSDVSIGDSIAVNGVCLTVTSFGAGWFTVDVIPETFRGTSLATTNAGSEVNLERAMSAGGRFGGHFVSGHVDTVGKIKKIWTEDNAQYVHITIDQDGLPYIALKGSITVDGTSLTIFGVKEDGFVISLIPETRRATVLGAKRQGDIVNVEYDVLAKYMERMLGFRNKATDSHDGGLTSDKLQQYGFID